MKEVVGEAKILGVLRSCLGVVGLVLGITYTGNWGILHHSGPHFWSRRTLRGTIEIRSDKVVLTAFRLADEEDFKLVGRLLDEAGLGREIVVVV